MTTSGPIPKRSEDGPAESLRAGAQSWAQLEPQTHQIAGADDTNMKGVSSVYLSERREEYLGYLLIERNDSPGTVFAHQSHFLCSLRSLARQEIVPYSTPPSSIEKHCGLTPLACAKLISRLPPSPGGRLMQLGKQIRASHKPSWTRDTPENAGLVATGARPVAAREIRVEWGA